MIRFVIIMVLGGVCLSTDCGSYEDLYVIVNDTSEDVLMIGFSNLSNVGIETLEPIRIDPNDSLQIFVEDAPFKKSGLLFFSSPADSLDVIFSSNRILRLYCGLDSDSLCGDYIGDRVVITEEHVKQAMPCQSPCF